jgi:peroxiredoxin
MSAQPAMHDFTVTDIDGQTHRLYQDYLNQGEVVAIKFFFSTCPPCNQAAPQWQQKYNQWSQQDVSFFTVTTITSDYDPQVNGFRNNHNLGMPCVSHDGGASTVTNPFKSATYGSWFGTPSYVVIAPNGRVFYPVFMSNFDATIQMAKAEVAAPPTLIQLEPSTPNFQFNPNHVRFFIHPENNPSQRVEIVRDAQGLYNFEYPSASYPQMTNPVITMESEAPAYTTDLRASDLTAIQKHLLILEPFENDYELLAADTNGDDRITAGDIVQIQKAILDLIQDFPNGTPSYKMIPASIPVSENPGQTTMLDITVVKMGNVR